MPNSTAVVTAKSLNLRPEPSANKKPIGVLGRGTELEILETLEHWYEVKSPKGQGYVHSNYVTVFDHAPCVGFLHERDDLKSMPLEPAAAERIKVGADFSASQKGIARTWNRQGGMLGFLSEVLETEPASSIAVLYTESAGRGFGADGRMIIRFENHVFWRRWGKKHPDVFNKHFKYSSTKSWQGHMFRATPNGTWQKFHGKQTEEWKVLDFARKLDDDAALRSISMGGPQIMGFNHSAIGYETPREMFDNFQSDVRYHVLGLFDFMKGAGCTSQMLEALRLKKFEDFAARYNGPGQASVYGHRIEQYHDMFQALRA
ncbi:MAG: DUF3380 domain-containing protein [bacterium]|nr:DUF3380 domain-containing protein [bacterium]